MRTSSRRFVRSMRLTLSALLLAASLAPAAFTQQSGGNFTLHPTVVPGGGGASMNGALRLEGSAGQPVVAVSSGAPYNFNSGFWPNAVPCPFAVSPTGQFFTMAGGGGSVNVIAPGFCDWATTVQENWITVVSAGGGSGNEVVNFEVRENFTGSARQAFITVSGLRQLVVQDGGLGDACNYEISPLFENFMASGGAGTIRVTASQQCAWQAVATPGWITITSINVGIGSGTVAYTVSNNPGPGGRSGKVVIAGRVFAVKQSKP